MCSNLYTSSICQLGVHKILLLRNAVVQSYCYGHFLSVLKRTISAPILVRVTISSLGGLYDLPIIMNKSLANPCEIHNL